MALLLMVCGCSFGPAGLARQLNLEAPQVRGVSYSLVSASPDSFTADITLSIYNPNSMTVGLSGLNCQAFVNGVKAADITQTGPAVLEAHQISPLNLRAVAPGGTIGPCIAGHIARGETSTLSLAGTAYIVFGWLSFPYPFTYERNLRTDLLNYKKLDGEKPLPLAGLSVTGLSLRWGGGGPDSIQVISDAVVTNRGRDTYTLSTPGYEVRGNGSVLARGTVVNGSATIRPGDNTVLIVNTINTQSIAPWLASHLNGGERTSLELNFMPGSSAGTQKDMKSLDGRAFKADVQTNLAYELERFKDIR
jgi:LEA14-like dessication related protein